ncbi:MAG: metallophosphoesterase [Deltaproteobacteria bacterium]|nr:metallophosphoesterase [Deltaproteobacteria bacterium]
MVLFLLVFFLIYGGVHSYAYLKIRAALHPSKLQATALILSLLLLMMAPIIVRFAERYGFEMPACLCSWVGYLWMGVLFLFFSVSLCLDLYRLILSGAAYALQRDFTPLLPSPLTALILPLVCSLGIAAYAAYEAIQIRTERIVLESPKIPAAVERIRLVQISDVHVGLIVGEERLRNIVETVRKAQPDILLSTGDLVDGQIDSLRNLGEVLREVAPRYGKYAVTGNHEFYAGLPQALAFTRQAGFTVLRGEGMTVAGLVNIAGVDDPTGRDFGLRGSPPEREILDGLPRQHFTILLKHQPILRKESLGAFDLQLSGHTHKGQIFPFSLITRLFFPYHTGFFRLPGHGALYVSRGTGTWGPPMRFLAPPEITVIDLVPPGRGS